MIRSFRAFFLSRVMREKLLLVGFLGLGVVMWASSFSSRASRFWREQHATTVQLKDQDNWLAQRGAIAKATAQAAAQMDPAKTLDPTGLAVTVRELADRTGVQLVSLSARTNVLPGGQFSVNSQQFQVQNTDWSSFKQFYQQVQQLSPYVAITQLALQPVLGNPAQIRASLAVASFEIKH